MTNVVWVTIYKRERIEIQSGNKDMYCVSCDESNLRDTDFNWMRICYNFCDHCTKISYKRKL